MKKLFFRLLFLASLTYSQVSLANEPHLKFCVDPDWYPYEKITPQGEYIGIAAELISKIVQKANITYSIVRTQNWEESIEFSKKGFCDALAFLNQTPQREEWLVFSEPYFTDPNVIISREQSDYISDLSTVSNLKIALPKGSSILEKVKKDFPNLYIIEVESEEEAFSFVSKGKADITLRSLTMAIYTIKSKGWFNLKVAGEVPRYVNRLRIGIVKEKSFFQEILNQGILDLKPQLAREIANRYVAIKIQKNLSTKEIILYSLAFLGALILFFGFLLYQRKMNKRLENINERYKSLIEGSREGIVVTQHHKIIFSNPSFSEITGYSFEELKDIPIDKYLYEEDKQRAMQNHEKRVAGLDAESRYPVRFLTKDGKTIWVEVSGTLIHWGNEPATLNFIVDITQRIQSEEKIKFMAHHDALTDLPNRWLMDDRLEQQIASARREKRKFALLFVDLNKFKPINDTFGHETGDFVLKTFALRLSQILRQSDTVSRVGGDEYVIMLPNTQTYKDAQNVREKIINLSQIPFSINEQDIFLTCSVGIALFPDDGESKDALYTAADNSMYKEKKS